MKIEKINPLILSILLLPAVLICATENQNSNLEELIKLANENNAESQYELGLLYMDGKTLKKNYETAFHWLGRAAIQGHLGAIELFGLMNRIGLGTPKNPKVAEAFYVAPAKKGNIMFMHELGVLYFHDLNDPKEGIRWLTAAARKDHSLSQFQLGVIYFYGYRVEQNIDAAEGYFKDFLQGLLSSEEKNRESDNQYAMGSLYEFGYGVEVDYPRAIKWYEKAARGGNNSAKFILARKYFLGENVGQNEAKAKTLIGELLAELEEYRDYWEPYTKYDFSLVYRLGIGVERDIEKSFQLLKTAASTNLPEALFDLGFHYYIPGLHVNQDIDKGIGYVRKSAALGNSEAHYTMGLFFEKGIGVPHDLQKAALHYQEAAKRKYPKALHRLGAMHLTGLGTTQNGRRAFEFFLSAAKYGSADSMYRLGQFYSSGHLVGHDPVKARYWYNRAADSFPPALGIATDPTLPLYNLAEGKDTEALAEYGWKMIEVLEAQKRQMKRDFFEAHETQSK